MAWHHLCSPVLVFLRGLKESRTARARHLSSITLVRRPGLQLAVATTALLSAISAGYADEGEGLREPSQNPIADLISRPFHNNTNFDIGRSDNTQNVLNIQPVYPAHLNPDWNLIIRPILPVIYQPPFFSGSQLHALEEIAGPDIGD